MPLTLIDAHCHLTDGRIRGELAAVLARAQAAGVRAVICSGADVDDSAASAELAREHEAVYFTAGVHPHQAANPGADYLRRIEQLAALPKNLAIGEIGLDYHYHLRPQSRGIGIGGHFSPRDLQRQVFAEQLDLARRLGKCVVVHTRQAFEDALAVLKESGIDGRKVVFHSFVEDAGPLARAVEFGAMIGLSGIVTFRDAGALRQAVALVPDDRLLVETDAPYLSPEPLRSAKWNEPANVVHVARCLAEARRTTPERIAELTTANARRFFGLQAAPSAPCPA